MAKNELINHIRVDTEWMQQAFFKICRDLQLRKRVRFIFHDTWSDVIEETGESVTGTESREVTWNGEARRMRERDPVRIQLSSTVKFPMVWNVSGAVSGHYPVRLTCFRHPMEMFIYFAAHELRHLWQLEHPGKTDRQGQFVELDDDADADTYAHGVLSRYRQDRGGFDDQARHRNK